MNTATIINTFLLNESLRELATKADSKGNSNGKIDEKIENSTFLDLLSKNADLLKKQGVFITPSIYTNISTPNEEEKKAEKNYTESSNVEFYNITQEISGDIIHLKMGETGIIKTINGTDKNNNPLPIKKLAQLFNLNLEYSLLHSILDLFGINEQKLWKHEELQINFQQKQNDSNSLYFDPLI